MKRSIETSPILVIGCDEDAVRSLDDILVRDGFQRVHTFTDSRRVLPAFREVGPDLAVIDLHMPHMDGLEVMRQIRARLPSREYFPFLLISGNGDPGVRQRALRGGANDFLGKPFDAGEVTARVRNLLHTRHLHSRVSQLLRQRTNELRGARAEMAERLAAVAEFVDVDAGHPRRVGELSAAIGDALGLPTAEVALLRRAAQLHDIGKVALPDVLLLRPGPLDVEEMDLVKSHTSVGARMLSGSRSPLLQMAQEIALHHHDNWDGSGYTPGLATDAIPLVARIVAIADVYDALTHERPYKQAWSADEALTWIRSQSGQKFDPAVVDALILAIGELVPSDAYAHEGKARAVAGRAPQRLDQWMSDPAATQNPRAAGGGMEITVYHVFTKATGWAVEREGASQAEGVYPTEEAAIARGRELCLASQPSRLKVHKSEAIEIEYGYGQDPHSSAD